MRILSLLTGMFFTASIAFGDDKQIITLDDGTKLTLLGTTFGSRHMAPGYENLRTANWVYTASNTPVVWIEEEPGNQPIYELLVSDRANTGCVNIEARQRSFVKSASICAHLRLKTIPFRVRMTGFDPDSTCPRSDSNRLRPQPGHLPTRCSRP